MKEHIIGELPVKIIEDLCYEWSKIRGGTAQEYISWIYPHTLSELKRIDAGISNTKAFKDSKSILYDLDYFESKLGRFSTSRLVPEIEDAKVVKHLTQLGIVSRDKKMYWVNEDLNDYMGYMFFAVNPCGEKGHINFTNINKECI